MSAKEISKAREARAKELHATGLNGLEIAKRIGVTKSTVYRWINPKSIKTRAAYLKKKREAKGPAKVKGVDGKGEPHPDEVAKRLAEIPPDTRSPGEVLMGDPLPGRRALDRRN